MSQGLNVTLVCDDVLHWAANTPPIGAHALLADAPYELSFMSKNWDNTGIAFRPETWQALAQHLLPGAFGMVFGSSRGWHRLACAIEDAGLILHPSIFMLGWATGQSFPKSTRIDSQVDNARRRDYVLAAQRLGLMIPCRNLDDWTKEDHIPSNAWWERFKEVLSGEQWQAIEREVIEKGRSGKTAIWDATGTMGDFDITAPATPLAQTWAGHRYGRQALKNSLEPIIVFQVPYAGRAVDSIVQYGAGALNIEGGRLAGAKASGSGQQPFSHDGIRQDTGRPAPNVRQDVFDTTAGRWPANLALCHLPACVRVGEQRVPGSYRSSDRNSNKSMWGLGETAYLRQGYGAPDGTETVPAYVCAPGCAVAQFDRQAGERTTTQSATSDERYKAEQYAGTGYYGARHSGNSYEDDTGNASRFFYTADWALDVAEQLAQADPVRYVAKASRAERDGGLEGRNSHPTIKPISLCNWLATLLLPPAAYTPRRLLVPFCGTGSEILGAMLAGWDEVLGIEQDATYVDIGRRRIAWWTGYTPPTPEAAPPTPPASGQQMTLF